MYRKKGFSYTGEGLTKKYSPSESYETEIFTLKDLEDALASEQRLKVTSV